MTTPISEGDIVCVSVAGEVVCARARVVRTRTSTTPWLFERIGGQVVDVSEGCTVILLERSLKNVEVVPDARKTLNGTHAQLVESGLRISEQSYMNLLKSYPNAMRDESFIDRVACDALDRMEPIDKPFAFIRYHAERWGTETAKPAESTYSMQKQIDELEKHKSEQWANFGFEHGENRRNRPSEWEDYQQTNRKLKALRAKMRSL